jgi:hypothetical protein
VRPSMDVRARSAKETFFYWIMESEGLGGLAQFPIRSR